MQRGNTCRQVRLAPRRSFHGRRRAYGGLERNGVCDANILGRVPGCRWRRCWRVRRRRADTVPPFKGNDTGGIIAYSLATQADARQLAVDHCASYGKVVKFLARAGPLWRLRFLCLPLGALWRRRAAAAHALLSAPLPWFPAGHVFATRSVCSRRARTILEEFSEFTHATTASCVLLAVGAALLPASGALPWSCRCARPVCGR